MGRSRPSIVLATLAVVVAAVVVAGGACGGSSKGPATAGNGGGPGGHGGGLAARLPWEAALTEGATFTLGNQVPESGDASVTVKVVAVEEDGGARVYRLDWGEGDMGPTQLRVEGTTVTVGDARAEDMKAPFARPGSDTICYGADYSNPEGCDDVCDADLCLSPAGIVGVSGLYAPGYGIYGDE